MHRNLLGYGVVVACVVVLTALLLVVPSYFLATGVQAAGAVAGWWIGDPTVSDGEETWATAMGGVACAALLAAGAGGALALRGPFGVRSRMPALLAFGILTALFVAGWAALLTHPGVG